MKIYTKTGDKGKTSLFGGKKGWKDDLRIRSYGTVDELNSILGVAVTEIKNKELKQILSSIQHELFNLGSDLASPEYKGSKNFFIPRINKFNTKHLEELIDKIDAKLLPLKNFILPGGLKGAALLHHARTVCRRAERGVVSLAKVEEVNSEINVCV